MQICSGLRIGVWNTSKTPPFQEWGTYIGPDLGDHGVGEILDQELPEGKVVFQVGVLFRHDLQGKNKLETILIFVKCIPEMWNYDTWLESP